MEVLRPTPTQRARLWLWCLCTFFSTVSLLLYLPMSTMPAAEELSERPTILTISFVGCALLSLLLGRKALASPVFAPARSAMRAGTIAALVGLGLYSTYIYGFSKTLPQSTAPDIGEKAPLFSSTTPEGQVFSLEELRGGPILLLFYRGNW